RFSEAGFESMKMGDFCCLDAQNGLTFTGPARPRFSPLSAGSSVLDALWIVAIILEQPAYALIVPRRSHNRIYHTSPLSGLKQPSDRSLERARSCDLRTLVMR